MVPWLAPVFIVIAVLAGMSAAGAAGPVEVAAHAGAGATREQIVVVSRVSRSARKHQPRLEVFADWLATRLKDQGIVAGAGLVARNSREMIALLREGRVDVVSESVLTAVRYEEEAGAEILMHEWRRALPYYQSVFITLRDAPIFRLEDLVGRRIAFEDRGSSTAFLLPLATITRAGLKAVELPSPVAPVPSDSIGYVFAGSEANISAWTASGVVEAGAYSNRDWERKSINPSRYRNKMRVFHATMPLLHSVVLIRPGFPPERRRALIDALRAFAAAPDAVAVRDRYYDVTQFGPIDGKVAQELAEARAVYRSIRQVFD